MILTTTQFHQPRLYATFLKQNPHISYINVPAKHDKDWKPENITRLLAEIDKLQTYAEKGDIAEQEIPEETMNAYR